MEKIYLNFESVALKCAKKHSVDYNSLKDCANGKLGNTLLFDAGEKTNSLDPELNYVPWITANGAHSYEIQNESEGNLPMFICSQLKELYDIECNF